jgi:hypothetical protein
MSQDRRSRDERGKQQKSKAKVAGTADRGPLSTFDLTLIVLPPKYCFRTMKVAIPEHFINGYFKLNNLINEKYYRLCCATTSPLVSLRDHIHPQNFVRTIFFQTFPPLSLLPHH